MRSDRVFAWLVLFLFLTGEAFGGVITLKNGMQLEGDVGKIGAIGESPLSPSGGAGEISVKQIVLVDDDLRRRYVPSMQVAATAESVASPPVIIHIDQTVAKSGPRIGSVGPILRVTEFDDWGRRIYTMKGPKGNIDVIQGITEITPSYTRVEGLTGRSSYVWDMRLATSSLSYETIRKVVKKNIKWDDPDERLELVRLFIQAERYKDARVELAGIVTDFPKLKDLQDQARQLRQLEARRLIDEIELRADAGQHRLALGWLERFPTEGVAGEILARVRGIQQDYEEQQGKGKAIVDALTTLIPQIEDAEQKKQAEAMLAEISTDLTVDTLPRFAAFLRLKDNNLAADRKVALAISGWLLGSDQATENLAIAASLVQVRELVVKYLQSERPHDRTQILGELEKLEGSSPEYIADLLKNMKPAIETPSQDTPPVEEGAEEKPEDGAPKPPARPTGLYRLTTNGLVGQADIEYFVQLPPEYDPYRKYPTIVTLGGAAITPEKQIDWWAGAYSPQVGMRLGQATRRGYIVISPAWSKPHQVKYEYSARAHASVLYSLRDACRRFSIDTDQVFLSGHSMGGEAAWDIGLAHPDLWAGVIPLVAKSDRYIQRYWENGRGLPMYFVFGEMDGDRMISSGQDLDRYLTKSGYDIVISAYQGRGHEHFQDEIQDLFTWMGYHRRNFFPEEFEAVTMRPWDNFFWWLELDGLPARTTVVPARWPPDKSVRPNQVEGRLASNRVTVRSGARDVTIWLSPDNCNFNERLIGTVDSRRINEEVRPSVEVMLEDTRTRADRLHPFWAKVEME